MKAPFFSSSLAADLTRPVDTKDGKSPPVGLILARLSQLPFNSDEDDYLYEALISIIPRRPPDGRSPRRLQGRIPGPYRSRFEYPSRRPLI